MTDLSAKIDLVRFHPEIVKPGDMAVATDERGDHYCVFLRRVEHGWETLSVKLQKTMVLSDEQFEILVKVRNFRPVPKE